MNTHDEVRKENLLFCKCYKCDRKMIDSGEWWMCAYCFYKMKKMNPCIESEYTEEIKQGDHLITKSGDYHLVLKVEGEGYIQSTRGNFSKEHGSRQSMNYPRAKQRITIWDGLFVNKRDIEEVEKIYDRHISCEPCKHLPALKDS